MGRITLEAAKTVLEVADIAFKAAEISHHYHLTDEHQENSGDQKEKIHPLEANEKELEALRSENKRLRDLLEQNLELLHNISESPCLIEDCPPDLHSRLMHTVESPIFLSQLKSLHNNSIDGFPCKFPQEEPSGIDLQPAEILVNVGFQEPSLWIWVSDEMVYGNVEEKSEIDNEDYVVINEKEVVDGVANFMARCIMLNPKAKNLAPEEMQKSLTKALGGMSKFEKILELWNAAELFYCMTTWGLALAGLYKSRMVLRLAAKGVHTTSKLALRAL